MTRRLRNIALLFLLGLSLSACDSKPPLTTVDSVDLGGFAGKWYIVANIPNFFERNKVGSKTTFLKKGPGLYDDIYEFRTGSFDQQEEKVIGKAKSINTANTVWQSTFYTVVRSEFEVLQVDQGYQLMALGHTSRDYGWIFSRTPHISEEDFKAALATFSDNGYDVTRFLKIPQLPEQIGQPGFQIVAN